MWRVVPMRVKSWGVPSQTAIHLMTMGRQSRGRIRLITTQTIIIWVMSIVTGRMASYSYELKYTTNYDEPSNLSLDGDTRTVRAA